MVPLERNLGGVVRVDTGDAVGSGLWRHRFAFVSIVTDDSQGRRVSTYMICRKIGTALLQNALRFDSAAKTSSDFQRISFTSTNSAWLSGFMRMTDKTTAA